MLDAAAGPLQHWERQGRLIRLRSRKWFFDRPREVPLRLVRGWQAFYEQQGALPLAEYLQMVATLNDGQIESVTNLANIKIGRASCRERV